MFINRATCISFRERLVHQLAGLVSSNAILTVLVALAIIVPDAAFGQAQTLDKLTFGDPTSESGHGFATSFSTVTPASIVSAGGGATPSDPSSTDPSVDVVGALNQPGTKLLPRTPNADIYGGQVSFTMAVDPVQQNYVTVKFWGSESATNEWLVLDCNGFEVGSRHIDGFNGNSEGEQLWHYNTGWYPNRWVYRTIPLPLNLTHGRSSVSLTIRSMGWLAFYASGPYFGGYAKLMNSPSPIIYEAVTHTNPFFDSSAETQGTGPTPLTPLTSQTPSSAIARIESTVNSKVAGYLKAAPGSLTPDTIDYLAQTYGTTWSTYSGNPAVVAQVIAGIDALTTAYAAAPTTYMGNFGNSSWGGYFGPVGDAIMRLWPQINTGTTMSTTVDYGGSLGSVSRTAAWSAALRASIDWGRFNRQSYTNQQVTNAQDIYLANRGLELVQSSNALNESEALRYLYEASGLSPFLGNDLAGEGPVPVYGTSPYGPNWYEFTSAGTSKEEGFVGSDYGEQGPMIYRMGIIAGDAKLQAQGLKLYRARAPFRYTGTDANGYQLMMGTEPIGLRNSWEMPGHPVYLGHYSADDFLLASQGASVIGNDLMGYFQQGINDGQAWQMAESVGYGNVGNNNTQLPLLPDYWTKASTQPQTGVLLPQTNGAGLPDFGWADEQNMVVSAKHGTGANEENFYANLNWRDPAYINGMAKVFDLRTDQARDAEVQMQDEQFVSSGITLYGSNIADNLHEPWDNPTMATAGLPFMEAMRSDLTSAPSQNQDGGRGTGYTLRWGHWLVGMNAYQTSTGTSYAMKMPSDFTSGTDLISGQTFSGQVTLQPQTAVVFYMDSVADPCPVPSVPLNVRYSANNTAVMLTWTAVAGAATYNVSRGAAADGPFTQIASGITATNFTDNISVGSANGPYYFVTATNSCGTSSESSKIGPVVSTQLPSDFGNQDVGTVSTAGTSTYEDGVFSVSGGGSVIGATADSFQYAYSLVNRDGDYITRLISTQAVQAGLMIRASLANNSAMAIVMFDQGMGLARFAERASTGAGAVYTNGASSTTPLWLRLNKSGSTVTAYSSTDGITWNLIGTSTVTYGAQFYVGFAVTSRNQTPALAKFDSFMGVPTSANALPTTFTDLDIGTVGTAGLATYVNGTYDVFGAGTGVASTADSFNFNYATITADGDYIAEVLNQDAAQEGLMVRASLDPNSSMATVLLTGGHTNFLARTSTGGSAATAQGAAAGNSPVWLRLNKSGNVVTGYTSTDGVNWTNISSTTISFGSSFYVGFAVSSEGSATQSGLFSNLSGIPSQLSLSVTPLNSYYMTPVTVAVTPVNTQNVIPTGTVAIYDWGTLLGTVPLSGGTASWQISPSMLAGVHDLQAVYGGDTVYPQQTSPVVAATVVLAPGQSGPCPLPAAPQNLSYSANNTTVFLNWSAVPNTLTYNVSRSLTSGSGFTVVASGISSTSYSDAFAATSSANAPYYVVSATNACGTGPTSTQIGPVQSTALPSNFANQDVGAVQTTGSSTYTNGAFTISGSGSVIGAMADSFQYAYSLVSSDGDYITRVVSDQANQSGLMIRASLASNAAMAIVMYDKGFGMTRFAERASTGAGAIYTNGPTTKALPVWLRLNKSGSTLTGYSSVDGINWVQIGSSTVTYGSQFYVGFAVTNRSATIASAHYDSLMGIPTAVNQLPTALTSVDIGTVSTAGSATYVNGLYDVFGSGSVIGSSSDSFQFTYATETTDGDYVTQVLNQDAVMEGIMVRSSLNANSPMAVVMLNTAMARFAGRPNAGNVAVFTNGPSVTSNPIWLRLNKTGSLLTGYTSVDDINWTQIGSTTINSFGNQFYVGLAVTSRASNSQSGMFAALSGIPAPLALQLSSSSITYSSPEILTVTPVKTQSTVPSGSVALYDTGTLLTTLTLSNGTASWTSTSPLALGTHLLTAVYSGDTVYPQETSVTQTLTVTQDPVTVSLSNLNQTYTGSPLSPTVTTTPSGIAVSLAYNGSSAAPTAAGSYSVVGTVTNPDYSGSATGTFIIAQATTALALTASPGPALQGTTERLTATVTGNGQPSGTVVFTSGVTTLCSVTLNGSTVATCSFVPSVSSSMTITASYQGDGNHLSSSASTTFFVYDPQLVLQVSNTQSTYPGATNTTACVTSGTSITATGSVQIYDGPSLLTTQSLQGNGCAYWYISPGLNAGTHYLTAHYSGDQNNAAGTSVPVTVTVSPVQVVMSASCWNASFAYGGSYTCAVSLSSNAGSAQGALNYTVDGGSTNSVAINNGNAQFSVTTPDARSHSVTISYPGQGNFAAASPVTESFTVSQAQTRLQLTPSSYSQSASAPFSLTASLTSSSAGAPTDGSVAFYDGTTVLGTLPAASTVTFGPNSLSPGQHSFTAAYQPGASGNYGAVTSSPVTVQLN